MKTVEQIMELISDYTYEVEDIAISQGMCAHIGKFRYAQKDKALDEVRTAIEELVVALEKEQSLTAHHRTVQLELMAKLAAIKGEKV